MVQGAGRKEPTSHYGRRCFVVARPRTAFLGSKRCHAQVKEKKIQVLCLGYSVSMATLRGAGVLLDVLSG